MNQFIQVRIKSVDNEEAQVSVVDAYQFCDEQGKPYKEDSFSSFYNTSFKLIRDQFKDIAVNNPPLFAKRILWVNVNFRERGRYDYRINFNNLLQNNLVKNKWVLARPELEKKLYNRLTEITLVSNDLHNCHHRTVAIFIKLPFLYNCTKLPAELVDIVAEYIGNFHSDEIIPLLENQPFEYESKVYYSLKLNVQDNVGLYAMIYNDLIHYMNQDCSIKKFNSFTGEFQDVIVDQVFFNFVQNPINYNNKEGKLDTVYVGVVTGIAVNGYFLDCSFFAGQLPEKFSLLKDLNRNQLNFVQPTYKKRTYLKMKNIENKVCLYNNKEEFFNNIGTVVHHQQSNLVFHFKNIHSGGQKVYIPATTETASVSLLDEYCYKYLYISPHRDNNSTLYFTF